MTDAELAAEVDAARAVGIPRMGCQVPTRHEVAKLPPQEIFDILELWMWESPTSLIPRNQQISDVLAVLLARTDQDVARAVTLRREYLKT